MRDTPPTRMALLEIKGQAKLAKKGHSLLEKKRDALIHLFFERIKHYKEQKQTTYKELQQAYKALHLAQGVNGVDVVKTAGFSQPPTFELNGTTEKLMGVSVPSYEYDALAVEENTSDIDFSEHLHIARKKFRVVAEKIVKLAEIEQVIYTLAEEITKTKRRVNALEHITIPDLEETQKHIETHLEEQERESFVRLKKIKSKLEDAAD